jgi:heme-degrading monooxygenase HmoA
VIVRILTARVPSRNASTFEALLRAQLPLMREHDGLVYVKLARQVQAGYENVLLFEEWRDGRALHGWAGPSLHAPRLLPGAEALVEDVHVTHYEALDMDPDLLFVTPAPAARHGGSEDGREPGTTAEPGLAADRSV